jgi:hypothetical protein
VSIKTSSCFNPKPATLIKVSQRGPTEYVLVGGYRLKRLTGGWHLYLSSGEGWGKPRRYATRHLATVAIAEHMATGKCPLHPLTIEQRVSALEAAQVRP